MSQCKISLICYALLLALTSYNCQASLVVDPGFEDPNSAAFWSSTGTVDFDGVFAVAPGISPVEGTETLRLVGNGDAVFSIAFQDIHVDGSSISVGNQVAVGGILGQTSGDPLQGSNRAFLEVSFVDAAGVEFLASVFQSTGIDSTSPVDVYQNQLTSFAIVPSNADKVRVKAVFQEISNDVDISGAAFFDNLELTVVPEPASVLLLATGILSIFVRRKR